MKVSVADKGDGQRGCMATASTKPVFVSYFIFLIYIRSLVIIAVVFAPFSTVLLFFTNVSTKAVLLM